MAEIFYSNCWIEMVKAKIRNPKVKVMKLPSCLNEVNCSHYMWQDEYGIEYDFWHKGYLPWYKLLWHDGVIKSHPKGTYKRWINEMIDATYYKGGADNATD